MLNCIVFYYITAVGLGAGQKWCHCMPLGFQNKLSLDDGDNHGGKAGRRCNCRHHLSFLYPSLSPKCYYCNGGDTSTVSCLSARHGTSHFAFTVSSSPYDDSEELESILQAATKRVGYLQGTTNMQIFQ